MRAFRLLFLWQYYMFRHELWLLITIQVGVALGIVYGLAFLIPDIDPRTAAYLATGGPTVSLLIFGMSSGPQEVSRDKLSGRHDYIAALPVPRLALPGARLAFWLLILLPGTALAVVFSAVRFDFTLDVSIAVVPAVLLVAFSGAAVGYGLGEMLRPEAANQAGSFLSLLILLFSPINFPIDRLPEALQSVHVVLPIKYMADLMRWSLTGGYAENIALAFAIVTLWCAMGIAASWRAAIRRP
jgi:ABC-2 type transport system permease protein